MHQSILTHRRGFWGYAALVLIAGSIAAYLGHDPVGPRSGGSAVGYTLGTIGAVLIVWLMWFGIRKRQYHGTSPLRGWLSAHIYLGLSLILVTLLHAGFQLGWNVHTAALMLMFAVIASGLFGVYAYLRYPTIMTSNRSSTTRAAMLETVAEIDRDALQIAAKIDPKVHATLLRSVSRTKLGGGVWAQLTARDATEEVLAGLRNAMLDGASKGGLEDANQSGHTLIRVVEFASSSQDEEKAASLRKLIDLLSRKRALAGQLARDVQLQAVMEFWLYLHVPLSFALLAALTGHIIAVFFYW